MPLKNHSDSQENRKCCPVVVNPAMVTQTELLGSDLKTYCGNNIKDSLYKHNVKLRQMVIQYKIIINKTCNL